MPQRNDYLEIYNSGGADALNKAIQERFPHENALFRELTRMEKNGEWQIEWDGCPGVIGRRAVTS